MKVKKFVKMKVQNSKGIWQNTDFSVREDGVLLNTYGKNENAPIFVGQDFIDAGLPMPKLDLDFEDYSEAEQALALTIDHPRVELTSESREALEKWLSGEEDREKERMARLNDKNNQNAFLKARGYRWEKRGVYHSNPGELVDAWFLLGPDGEVVCGWKDSITEELASTGPSLKNLLTELGYYGQEAIDRAEAKAKEAAARREMRAKVDAYFADDENRTGETFENAQSLFTAPPIEIEKHYPRRQFRIEKDCMWHEAWNSSDGDDWSRNNSSYGIARQYKFNAEIAECLRKLAK